MSAAAITVSDLKLLSAGTLIGFLDVHQPSGMTLHRCRLFQKNGRVWAVPPSKQVSRGGVMQRGANGRARYEQAVSFCDRATQNRWSDAVVAAARLAYPETFAAKARHPAILNEEPER